MAASTKVLLRNKPNAEGLYPVVLKVIKERKVKVISLGLSCLEKDWDKANGQFKKSDKNYLQRNRVILKFKEDALKLIAHFIFEEIDFTLNQFDEQFRGKKLSKVSVKEFWKEKVEDMNKAGRIGNGKAFKDTYNSFFKFYKDKDLYFREITPALLDKYETYLRSNNNTDGGIGVKMRAIRALFNDAIKKQVVEAKYYPFDTYKVSKLKGKSIKKALSIEEVRLMEAIDVDKYPNFIDTKNYFVFSYYMGGMNFDDMMKLKWENVKGDKIHYTRSKTKGNFSVKMLEPVQQIVNFYRGQNRSSGYVFPIMLNEAPTPKQIANRKHKCLKKFNLELKQIAEIQKIEQNVTSYVIRHSFATNLKFRGISTDVISQLMGHADVNITKSYLKDFDDKVMNDAMEKLLEEPYMKYAS